MHTRTRLWSLDSSQSQKVVPAHIFTAPGPTFIPGARKDTDTEEFRYFKQTLTHEAIANILLSIKPFTTTPDIIQCPNQHFRRAIYGLGPHISDYPEQAGATWILLNWCPTYIMLIFTCSVHGPNTKPLKVPCSTTHARQPLSFEDSRPHSRPPQHASRRDFARSLRDRSQCEGMRVPVRRTVPWLTFSSLTQPTSRERIYMS